MLNLQVLWINGYSIFLPTFSCSHFFWPCSSWDIYVSDTRGGVSLSSASVLKPVVSRAVWWVICTTEFPKACCLILHWLFNISVLNRLHFAYELAEKGLSKTSSPQLEKLLCWRVAWLFMSALGQPCADDFLSSVGSAALILQNCKLELLTWQQIRVVLSVPVYGLNSYLKILIWVGTWLSRAVFCISFSRQMSCTATSETVSAGEGWKSWHWQVLRYKIPVWCTQGASVLHRCPLSTSKVSPGRWPGLCCSC